MAYNKVEKLASAILNNVTSGLQGFHTNLSLSKELIEQYVVDERLKIIADLKQKGLLPFKDLYLSINCIPVDCKSLDRCPCTTASDDDELVAHFEIPQVIGEFGAIDFVGSTDRQVSFLVYNSNVAMRNKKYRKRGKNKPYIWIDYTPNENGMYDCFLYNAPMMQSVSITAIFKDLRQVDLFSCCSDLAIDNFSYLSNDIVDRVTLKLLAYYRQYATGNRPNDQTYQPG